ncbi:glycosyltransferase [Desertivirga brevis]|uniref:glycosyltransferase n=1 Tax=Desertivirga brevis TaxID=2810310 RepID=UPI0034E2CD25
MKIVHLNTYDGNGGAGRACLRLNKALNEQQEVSSEVWVGFKFGRDPDIQAFRHGSMAKAFAAFGILLERFVSSAYTKKLKIPFSIPIWGTDLTTHPALLNADVIHLHWVNHAFLRPKDLERLGKLNKPIVWTFHDSNAFTGGCHVRYSCDHFENECGNCPILKTSATNDQSHKIWKAKEKAYSTLNFAIIAPSLWMQASVKRSKLLQSRQIQVIPNTLETEVFKAYDKAHARKHLNLPSGKFIMLSGFMPSRKDLHKGTPYLLEALEILIKNKTCGPEDVELIVFGNRDEKNVPAFPVNTTFLGTISNDDKLAICYSAADVFLTPSLEDNLPNTVMESLSCGTPVVAFTTGGIPDMVKHQLNGYLAEYKSSEDFAKGIEWVYQHHNKESLNERARLTVEENFSEGVIAKSHLKLYKQILGLDIPFKPILSVITVVYNNVRDIERTILSVISQSYSNIEYIIVDGGSTDGTINIINRYRDKITTFISESDNGIYDAMNKGLSVATGDYVLFMNSGDELYDVNTVEEVFSSSPNADIYYGETEMFDESWTSLGQRRHQTPNYLTLKSFKYGMSVSHQAIYIKRSIASRYDTSYQLSSDIDWILNALSKAKKVINTKRYVAKYLVGGMSKKKHRQSLLERFHIFSRYYGLFPNLLNHLVIAKNLLVYFVKNKRTND